jgi:uncharacterized protein YecA (UPF0149 family)
MIQHIEDFINDYLSSQHYIFIDGEIKEHAETILHGFAYFINEQNDTTSNLEVLEKVLEKLSSLAIPLQEKKQIPDLLCSFFSYISLSGKFPEGKQWENDTATLKPQYLRKLRDDGSIRGETYRKQYTDVGRNDPCPCGSGLKFKKCCMKLID